MKVHCHACGTLALALLAKDYKYAAVVLPNLNVSRYLVVYGSYSLSLISCARLSYPRIERENQMNAVLSSCCVHPTYWIHTAFV